MSITMTGSGWTVHPPKNHPAETVNAVDTDWSPIIDELLRIRTLENDFDGEGTEAPPKKLVDGAIELAMSLRSIGERPPERVLASVNATVLFEWYPADGYRVIEVLTPTEAEGRFLRHGSRSAVIFPLTADHE
jgi:hypothetical protein